MVNFTSGSTGRPKGVARSMRSVADYIGWRIDAVGIGRDDVVATMGSPATTGASDAFAALLAGARLVIADAKVRGLPNCIAAIRDAGTTRFGFVPSALRLVAQSSGGREALARLRSLETGGEPVTAGDIALFRSVLPAGCPIHLSLGSTEALRLFSWTVRDEDVRGGVVPVGYLAPGRRVAFLDEDGRPAPPLDGGELVVADESVALGAWIDGALDRTRFPDDPGRPGARLYRTGDVLRLRGDGLAEFSGRNDRMVKLSGLKDDLSEVEAALRRIAGVREAAVVPVHLPGRPTLLVAFLEEDDGAHRTPDAEIRRRVVAETAPHMTPSRIRWLPSLPRLFNQKIDLVRLGALALAAEQRGA